MLAFHADPKIKAKYLRRVQAHFNADQIVQGATGQGGKGCAVWCTLDKYDHGSYETELGIPRLLARLEDGIFEGLSVKESKTWPAKFLRAIKPGADLSKVGPKFLVWLLEGVMQYAKPKGKVAIQAVIDLYKRQLGGEVITYDQWSTVRSAAYAAAYAYAAAATTAAYAAAYAAAAAAAAAAAYAAAAAAAAYAAAAYAADADAAYAAAAAADADAAYAAAADAADAAAAAKQKVRSKQAKKLLELLRECQ